MDDWVDSREFWQGKRTTVTGGAGFLGSHVVEQVKSRGADIVSVVRSKEYDLRDIEAVRRMLDDLKPDVLIHLAGRRGEALEPIVPIRLNSSMIT